MWVTSIGKEEVGQTLTQGVLTLHSSPHGLLESLDEAFSNTIGSWVVGCTPDVLNSIQNVANSSEMDWGPLSETSWRGNPWAANRQCSSAMV